MKVLLISLIMISTFAACKPLQAMLYCYLPYTNSSFKQLEYQNLLDMIQSRLDDQKINVKVNLCGPKENIALYDPNLVNTLWERYDILQIDEVLIEAITQPLLKVYQIEFNNFTNVIPAQWIPLSRRDDQGNQYFIGAPSFMCTYFRLRRYLNQSTEQILLNTPKISMAVLYLGFYINEYPDTTLSNFDYAGEIDSKVLDQLMRTISYSQKICPEDSTDLDDPDCLDTSIDTDTYWNSFRQIIKSSENLHNLMLRFQGEQFGFDHVLQDHPKKLVYLDGFIAKETADRQTVIDFYNFMLSDDIIRIYTQGLYTVNKLNTYLIPPTFSSFSEVATKDLYYEKLFNVINSSELMPIFEQQFYNGYKTLHKNIYNRIVLRQAQTESGIKEL